MHHVADTSDYHWERRYVHSLDDMARVADAPRETAPFDAEACHKGVEEVGGRGLPATGAATIIIHPASP